MMIKLYNEKQSYTVMKLDCMLQRAENSGSCDLNELQSFLVAFRQMSKKAQKRYEHLLDSMMELFASEEEELCY